MYPGPGSAQGYFDGVVECPAPGREQKPRQRGLTMVIDKGLGLAASQDLAQTVGGAIDMVKLAFGTPVVYPEEVLREKIRIYHEARIPVYPGGTLTEIAFFQGRFSQYLKRCREVGFSILEISEGTVDLTPVERESLILQALDAGFTVLSEVGKKDPLRRLSYQRMQEQIRRDLELGVFKVIIEGRDSGKGVGIYDEEGKIIQSEMDRVCRGPWNLSDIMIEAPVPSQQKDLLIRLGLDVNLGNVQPENVMALECMRRALRSDTLQAIVDQQLGASETG